jgi:hypothetical protein
MGGEAVEVKAKLSLDDVASSALGKIKKGFEETGDAEKKAQQGLADYAKNFVSTFAAMNAAPLASKIVGFGKSFVSSAADAQEMRREITGLIAVSQNMPVAQVSAKVDMLGEKFAETGIKVGVGAGEIREAFNVMLEMGRNMGDSTRTAQQLAQVTGVIGGNTAQYAQEWAFMSEGVLRTRGHLFQLLNQTGIFGKDIKKASASWALLTDAQRTDRLNKGLEQVGNKLSKIPPGFNQTVAGLEGMWKSLKKDVGGPILDALIPIFKDLQQRFVAIRPELKAFAKSMGTDVASVVKEAAKLASSAFEYLKTHADEIKEAISDAYKGLRTTIEFILAHKEEIALMFGGLKAFQLGSAVGKADVGGKAIGAAQQLGGMMGFTGSVSSAAAGLGLMALALAAVTAALWQYEKLQKDKEQIKDVHGGAKGHLEKLAASGDSENVQRMLASIRETEAARSGFSKMLDKIGIFNGSLAMTGAEFDKWSQQLESTAGMVQVQTAQLEQQAAEANAAGAFEEIVLTYNQASQLQNSAAQAYAAQMLVTSGLTVDAMKGAGMEIAGDMDEFAATFAKTGDQFKEALAKFLGGDAGKASKTPAPQVNMSGGQVFKINQDFRDQDPDRVAVVLRRELGASAIRRVQAHTSGAFGQ